MDSKPRDVVIMGGGLAGLCLALQLKQGDPDIDVLVVERTEHPPPKAAHKVGESTVEGAVHYFADTLGLRRWPEEEQLIKSGLRFYFSDGDNTDITRRVEIGPPRRLPVRTYQLDRGTWEERLGKLAVEAGVEFLQKTAVRDVAVAEDDGPHRITLKRDGEESEVEARYVVDATGRFQLLKRKLGLGKEAPHKANATWFRIPRKISVGDWSDDPDWQSRNQPYDLGDGRTGDTRYHATVHLVGHGWWLWIIPLAGEITSIGIVVDDRVFPIAELNSLEKSMAWMEEYEPQAYAAIAPHLDEVMDFKFLRHYSHNCERVFSDRWFITGVAGAFHDPLFSVGSDVIGWSNTFITDLILRDRAGENVANRAQLYNEVFLDRYVAPMFDLFQDKYLVMGNPHIFSLFIHWSTAWYWSVLANFILHDKITDLAALASVEEETNRSIELLRVVQRFLVEWYHVVGNDEGRTDYFIPVFTHPWSDSLLRGLAEEWSDEEFTQRFKDNLAGLEATACEIFWMAVQSLPDPPERRPIDPYKISMDPSRWEADGLFDAEELESPVDIDAELGDYRWFNEAALSKAS